MLIALHAGLAGMTCNLRPIVGVTIVKVNVVKEATFDMGMHDPALQDRDRCGQTLTTS